MKDYKKILEGVVNIINTAEKSDIGFANICTYIGENCPELKESEDEMMIQYFKDLAPFDNADELYEKYGFSHKDAIDWLEKQCEQKIKTPEESLGIDSDTYNKIVDECIYGEHKPAFSEEDERNLQWIIDEIEANKNHAPDYDVATYNSFLSLLKSLKERYTWKPSDEQMKALKDALNDAIFQYNFKGSMIKEEVTRKHAETIESLYNDLKKL